MFHGYVSSQEYNCPCPFVAFSSGVCFLLFFFTVFVGMNPFQEHVLGIQAGEGKRSGFN